MAIIVLFLIMMTPFSLQTPGFQNQLICPRHGWKFDLNNDGKCIVNNSSIESE
jgi:nitrite reductase/ring-hydroxylating ferredoxin subunit